MSEWAESKKDETPKNVARIDKTTEANQVAKGSESQASTSKKEKGKSNTTTVFLLVGLWCGNLAYLQFILQNKVKKQVIIGRSIQENGCFFVFKQVLRWLISLFLFLIIHFDLVLNN